MKMGSAKSRVWQTITNMVTKEKRQGMQEILKDCKVTMCGPHLDPSLKKENKTI